MKLGEGKKQKQVKFLADTGAIYSVLNKALTPVGEVVIMVKGATGQIERLISVNH